MDIGGDDADITLAVKVGSAVAGGRPPSRVSLGAAAQPTVVDTPSTPGSSGPPGST